MRLKTARVQNYRSIRDTGEFTIENAKTILVGPNETVILTALQQISPPKGVKGFSALRDYPRALYNDITIGKLSPDKVPVVTGTFVLDDDDKELLPKSFRNCEYTFTRYLDNHASHSLLNAPENVNYVSIKKNLVRLAAHVDSRDQAPEPKATERLSEITSDLSDDTLIAEEIAASLKQWLNAMVAFIDETNETEEHRLDELLEKVELPQIRKAALKTLNSRLPVIVLYSNYFRVHPVIHLTHLATRLSTGVLDDDQYDYGNSCLLKLLGFTAAELSQLGQANEPAINDRTALQAYRDQLDKRTYQLNAASVRLTTEIRKIWNPNPKRAEADKLRIQADGQYLKVVVEDDLGVEIELNQRSEGFQWLVSFFIVFFAEAAGQNENAILLLDEPGLSLHALKQRDFRDTISRLAKSNQTIYSTHSPFLVGPDELDFVRVVEMVDRNIGTKVHTYVTSNDPVALLPLQEALGYDLAQSLFAQRHNLVLEGLTDYWYIEAVSGLLNNSGLAKLNDKIALIPASSAGKVIYFATILHAHNLKVAALLDSDAAGDQTAKQDTLVHLLSRKSILRTKDYIVTETKNPSIEDLLRETLIVVAAQSLGWDISQLAKDRPNQPIVQIFMSAFKDFSKYRLAKAFLNWSRDHGAQSLTEVERSQWVELINAVNSALFK
jgi:predicted ATP-dependent endonuclease of OLD family